MDEEYAYQDERLNRSYKRLLLTLSASEQIKLRDEERRWLSWRKHRCGKYEIELAAYGCELEMAADRATQLEERLGK